MHAILRVDARVPETVKRNTCDELFKLFKQHFAALHAKRYLALSMELVDMRGLQGEA